MNWTKMMSYRLLAVGSDISTIEESLLFFKSIEITNALKARESLARWQISFYKVVIFVSDS